MFTNAGVSFLKSLNLRCSILNLTKLIMNNHFAFEFFPLELFLAFGFFAPFLATFFVFLGAFCLLAEASAAAAYLRVSAMVLVLVAFFLGLKPLSAVARVSSIVVVLGFLSFLSSFLAS